MKIFSWLILIFLFLISNLFWVSGQCLNDQRSLLQQFKNELTYSNASTKLVRWASSVDCCQWEGVDCDRSGHIIALELYNESITRGIENSSSLFSLQYLKRLNLAYNTFNGIEIPKGLSNLTNLQYLNLSNAGFGGQIPIEVSEMTSLVSIDLSSQFQFAIPLKLENPNLKNFVKNLSGLEELYLDGVNITDQANGWWEAASSLPNLLNLSLRHCELSGSLHASSASQIRSLSVLRLDRNNLSTTNLDFLTNFTNLTILTLSFCSLKGHFPGVIFKVHTLQYLDLSNNLLRGTIPEFSPGGSFRTIVLSYTNFSGSLPDSIGNLSMLSNIDLSNCNFSGSIPSRIANLQELVRLDFSFNNFTGSIPVFRMLENLTYIDLSHNGLNGSLKPTHFEGLSNLQYLDLGSNSITGNIPSSSLFRLSSLQKLILSNNKFSGQVNETPIPSSFKLDTLDLSSNLLEGSLPKFFFNLERLNVLSLSSNSFNGTIGVENIRSLQNLTRLELAYNNLSVSLSHNNSESSPFPQLRRLNLASCNLYEFPNLRNQSGMTFLDLSNNKIQGNIPSWIWEIGNGSLNLLNLSCNSLVNFEMPYNISSGLSVLDLHANKLQGKMPVPPQLAIYVDYSSNDFTEPIDIGNSKFALFFSAANNGLTGAIPTSLCNAAFLQVLDLSGNFLHGSIPPCLLQNISTLGVLNLGRNNIRGNIPDTFSVSCGLKTLDLSRNNIQGNVPASLANCRSLEVMNVGNNNISDSFPCILKNLSSLRVLVLRSNNFNGNITCPLVNQSWPNLQIIDIASNNFTGHFAARCISSWKGMMLDNTATQNHLKFRFLNLNNFYYQDTVTVTLKGLELELQKILTVFTSIDLSSNNFQGTIPDTIGELSSLYLLNLSHNSFGGRIPRSIGNLTQLGSLDLSSNWLNGTIPQELSLLTSLTFLNLSDNNLTGSIPSGSQLQTFSNESYEGNTGLCGFPLIRTCREIEPMGDSPAISSKTGFDWQFIFTGLGYGAGAALVIAPLLFCKQWREECDEQLDRFLKFIYPRYGFSYVLYDGKVEAAKKIEDVTTDTSDDDNKGEIGEKYSLGRYCVFCTKIDIQMTVAFHNPRCTCYYTPPTFSSSVSSSSSSLLVVYSQRF